MLPTLATRDGIHLRHLALVLHALLGTTLAYGQIAKTPPIGEDEGRPRVAWQDADKVVGRTARVVGKVVRVGGTSRVQFLNFDAEKRDVFKIVIFQQDLDQFSQSLAAAYGGQWIEVRGHVTRYAGIPQMVVRHPGAIRVLTQPPDVSPTPNPRGDNPPRRPPGSALRVATFNVKNLFDAVDDPDTEDESTPTKPRDELEKLAHTLQQVDADIVALQEVEDRSYLERFVDVFLADMHYDSIVLFEGNDPRGIDVALLSRFPVGPVTSHRHRRFPGPHGPGQRFSRDVLCVQIEPYPLDPLEVWVVHLKSNADGRAAAEPIRAAEATALRALYRQQLAHQPAARILICGDFNDTFDSTSLQPLLAGSDAPRTLFENVPEGDRITYNRSPYRTMIDFILASPSMAETLVPATYQIHNLDEAESGSDHNPVSAEFR